MFESKEDRKKIDQITAPRRVAFATGSAAASVAGGVLGSKVSKKHPTIGALVGAALSGATVVAFAPKDCPKLSDGNVSGPCLFGDEHVAARFP